MGLLAAVLWEGYYELSSDQKSSVFGGLSGGLHILHHIVINNSIHYLEDHEELLATYGNPVINQGIFMTPWHCVWFLFVSQRGNLGKTCFFLKHRGMSSEFFVCLGLSSWPFNPPTPPSETLSANVEIPAIFLMKKFEGTPSQTATPPPPFSRNSGLYVKGVYILRPPSSPP